MSTGLRVPREDVGEPLKHDGLVEVHVRHDDEHGLLPRVRVGARVRVRARGWTSPAQGEGSGSGPG